MKPPPLSSSPIRIGLLAEGEAELGASVPYIKPQEGGKVIERSQEGALHTLIRRELAEAGLPDCEFVQRHPSFKERRKGQVRVGYSILNPKYLAQVIIAWLPHEVDMIAIVVDSDDVLKKRQAAMATALDTIRANHLDVDGQPILDRSVGGLAIKNVETWLLADTQAIETMLNVSLPNDLPSKLEELPAKNDSQRHAKRILDDAISRSEYLPTLTPNKREMQVRWKLAFIINLDQLKQRCPDGYRPFAQAMKQTVAKIDEGGN